MNAIKILKPFCKIGLHSWVYEYWFYKNKGIQTVKKCRICGREESEFKPEILEYVEEEREIIFPYDCYGCYC